MTTPTTPKSNSGVHRRTFLSRSLLVLALAFAMPNHNSFATDATWNEDPVSGDWNSAENWTPAVVPDGIANFGVSNITGISVSQNPTSIGSISFDSDASVYTFAVLPGSALLVSGTGVTNPYRSDQNFVCEGATSSSTAGGLLRFSGDSLASNLALTATGGTNGGPGGVIQFQDQSTSERCSISLSGNATLDISMSSRPDGVDIGRLTGTYSSGGAGIVNLGSNQLTIGSSNRASYLGGFIQDGPNGSGGSLHKVGTANLQLAATSTYTGGTIVDGGGLVALSDAGSMTGSGPVQVNQTGVLAGGGTIGGSVTIGPGAVLSPSYNVRRRVGRTLTIEGSLTLAADSIFHCNYLGYRLDSVSANGISIEPNVQLELVAREPRRSAAGAVYTILNNTSAAPINGTFANLPDGITFFERGNVIQASYEGGDGNDLTLTVLKSRDRN